MEFVHQSVLLQEAVDALSVQKDGIYVDATAGGGGHSSKIAELLGSQGKLVAIDRDPDAVAVLTEKFKNQDNIIIINDIFDNIKHILEKNNISGVDGILADLGVSSYQLDNAERGFSFHKNSPLDMRMSKSGYSAYDAVNQLSRGELSEIISTYGEERFASSIASHIVSAREKKTD